MRKYKMSILKTCYAVLEDRVVNFLLAVDGILEWGTGKVAETVVEQLNTVAQKSLAN